MSHELLLLSGPPGPDPTERRRRVLQDAARQVPGATAWQVFEDERTVVALVETAPEGGTGAIAEQDPRGGLVVVVGLSSEAARAAGDSVAGQHSGAEHGHVKVVLGPHGEIDISTDGTGIIPSFWAAGRGEVAFSTHLASLVSLGVSPTLDDIGSLEYLVMLQPLRARTVLASASLLPAGGRLHVTPGAAPEESVRGLYVPSEDRLGDDEAVHEFATLWSTVTRDFLDRAGSDRLALGLSGGLDSRAIGVECVRLGRRPHAFTYGSSTSRPARVATEVARLLQLDHTVLPLQQDRLLPRPAELAGLLDGAHSPAEMYELWFGPVLKEFADVVVNGHGGGPLWGDEKALGISDEARLLDTLERRFGGEVDGVAPFLADGLAGSARATFRGSLRDSLEPWTALDRPDVVSFWNVNNRQFRWGNMLATALRRSGLRLEAPFMDSRFLQFSARLTPEQRRNGRLYLRMHREVFAETAGVPRSDDGNPPRHLSHLYWSGESSFAHQFTRFAREHPISAARRASRRLQGNLAHRVEHSSTLARPAEAHLTNSSVFVADVWLRTDDAYRTRLRDFLDSAPTPPVLSAASVRRAVDEVASGRARGGALRLARIATLQAWSQEFDRRATALASVR